MISTWRQQTGYEKNFYDTKKPKSSNMVASGRRYVIDSWDHEPEEPSELSQGTGAHLESDREPWMPLHPSV